MSRAFKTASRRAAAQAPSWSDLETQILERLDLRQVYADFGVKFTGQVSAGDWAECHAIDRTDDKPSAAVHLKSGWYHDLGGTGYSASLWQFGFDQGRFRSWQHCRASFARQANVALPSASDPATKDPAEHLEWQSWQEDEVQAFCTRKPGIVPAAVQAAGGQLAVYRQFAAVVALPIVRPEQRDVPCGWVLYNRRGPELPVLSANGEVIRRVKIKTTSGSRRGLLGLESLRRLATWRAADEPPDRQPTLIKVEGCSDLLAVLSVIPEDERDRFLPFTNSAGAQENPPANVTALGKNLAVWVVPDADVPGMAGGEKWAQAFAAAGAAEVKLLALPFEVTENHGQDLRDYFRSGKTWNDFQVLAEQTPAFQPTSRTRSQTDQSSIANLPKPRGQTNRSTTDDDVEEADDDPHRLAKLALGGLLRHAKFWNDSWLRWRTGRYANASSAELMALLTTVIKEEFDALYLARAAPSDSSASAAASEAEESRPVCRKVTTSLVRNVLNALAALARVDSSQPLDTWLDGRTGDYLNLRNGILDLTAWRDGRPALLPADPLYLTLSRIDYDFDPERRPDSCPTWHAFLRKIFPDPEVQGLIQEWCGYCLVPGNRYQKMLLLEGAGANGKSAFCAGLQALVGRENTSGVRLELFEDRFQLGQTLGKRINFAAEVGELEKTCESVLKAFVSGDPLPFDRKFLPPLTARPTAKLVVSTNTRPRFTDKSDGIWRRLILVPMTVQIPAAERIAGMDTVDFWQQTNELPAMLAWALDGWKRLHERGGFALPGVCESAVLEYQFESDPTGLFIREHCELRPGASANCQEVYQAYESWARARNFGVVNQSNFGRTLRRIFGSAVGHKKVYRLGWIYEGLAFSGSPMSGG